MLLKFWSLSSRLWWWFCSIFSPLFNLLTHFRGWKMGRIVWYSSWLKAPRSNISWNGFYISQLPSCLRHSRCNRMKSPLVGSFSMCTYCLVGILYRTCNVFGPQGHKISHWASPYWSLSIVQLGCVWVRIEQWNGLVWFCSTDAFSYSHKINCSILA